MRFNQFLPEASIFTRGTYSFGHMVRVAADNKEGKILIDKIQEFADPGFDPANETLEWVDKPAGTKGVKVVPFKSSTNIKYFKRANGQIFGIQGGNSSIESALNHASKYNRGDIAEGILGAALSSKLIKRGSDRIGDVDLGDIQDVLGNAITKGSALVLRAEDKNSQLADVIEFTLRLPSSSMVAIRDQKNWPRFDDLFSSALEYVNGADVDRYANHFYTNGKVDEIDIISDGVSDQKGRKTDVVARVKNQQTGKFEDLKNVDISLKADSNIYHQHSSGGLTKGKAVWLSSAKALFEPLGITIDMPTKGTNNILTFWIAVYKQVAKKLDQALAGANANKETIFIEKLSTQIAKHATRDNKNLKLLSFFKGTYSIHSFNILKDRLIKNNIDLAAELKVGPRSGKPSIEIYDRNSGELLTAVRFYLSESASTNYWEKGPLLHELTRIVKDNYKKQAPAIPGAGTPAATTVPTAATPTATTVPTATTPAGWTPPTAKAPAFATPALTGKNVNTMQGNEWKSADDLKQKFDNRHDVNVEEEAGDKDVGRLQKLAGIRSYMSKGV
jgi:hypothetical protein